MSADMTCFQGVILEQQVEDNGIRKVAVYDYDNETKRILTVWSGWEIKLVIGRQYFMGVERIISGETTHSDGIYHRSNALVLNEVVEIRDRDSSDDVRIPITVEREVLCNTKNIEYMSDFRSKLKEAIDKKENDINTYEWLFFDKEGNKRTIRLMDATDDQLNQFLAHCDVMLLNDDENKPGRYIVKKRLDDLDDKLGSEIFMRNGIGDLSRSTIIELIENTKCDMSATAEEVFTSVPDEFKSIQAGCIIQAAKEQAGIPYFKQFTKALFYKTGVWVGKEELKDLQRKYQQMKTIPAIREELQLPDNIMVGISPETGLSLKDMKLALTLRGNNTRFHEFETEELIAVRAKLLPIVYKTITDHIDQWTTRRKRIQEVILNRMPSID